MIRILLGLLLLISPLVLFSAYAEEKDKFWALYSWIDDSGRWNYSLVRETEKHPDGSEVKTAATHNLETIKTRLSLLDHGSSIELNPLPILNMELHLPGENTLKEFERVCKSAQIKLFR